MNNELMKILKMVESKTITAEEGQKLIQTIEMANNKVNEAKPKNIGKFLHIDVESREKGDEAVVEINFPLEAAKSFLKMGIVQNQIKQHAGDNLNLDIEEINRLIEIDYTGDIVSVDTKDANVKIWIG
ncbi:MAG: hypothetical protein ACRCST_01365 [Turicibacter sp.]